MLRISNFWGSTSRLLAEHLWSPEQWLGTTDLSSTFAIIFIELACNFIELDNNFIERAQKELEKNLF